MKLLILVVKSVRAFVYLLYYKNRPRNIVFKGGLFQNRYNHKGQVKFSSYTTLYISVFVDYPKAFFLIITVFSENI